VVLYYIKKGGLTMEKVKKIAKYTVNILTITNALLVGLDPIWGYSLCR
jgi:hypothetical protein